MFRVRLARWDLRGATVLTVFTVEASAEQETEEEEEGTHSSLEDGEDSKVLVSGTSLTEEEEEEEGSRRRGRSTDSTKVEGTGSASRDLAGPKESSLENKREPFTDISKDPLRGRGTRTSW